MASDLEPVGQVTFVGTATTLLRLGSFTLLTDPNFLHAGERAYLGYGLFSRRLTNPAMRIRDLPDLDAVLLSHLHGDHFDRRARHGLSRSVPIITTPQAERRLRRWGFGAADGLPTWDRYELRHGDELLSVTSVPGHHGPGLLDRLLPPVMGSIIDLERAGQRLLRLYVTGDTLYRPELAEIPERFPGIDAMLVHLGGTRILGFLVTMDGRQGVDLMRLVNPKVTLPIHYDDYRVFRSPLTHFLGAAARHDLRPAIQTLRRGDTRPLVGAPQPCSPFHDHRGMLRPSGTSSADSW
jgi:L-ascorbate metabolism protein UlaG (beta-lactamase superfamily)